jgi:hypothetical protein
MIYTKDYLIGAYLDRYVDTCDVDTLLQLEENANKLYDEVGKDKFRTYASLDAKRLREYNG